MKTDLSPIKDKQYLKITCIYHAYSLHGIIKVILSYVALCLLSVTKC